MVISSVAEKSPSKIEKLVYLAAYLPASGQSLLGLASTDSGSRLGGGNVVVSPDQTVADAKPDQLVNAFIQDGNVQEQNLLVSNYRPEPARPLLEAVTLTEANFGIIPKAYINTLLDHVVSPSLQARMISAAAVKEIYELNAGHSVSLTNPAELTSILIKIAK